MIRIMGADYYMKKSLKELAAKLGEPANIV